MGGTPRRMKSSAVQLDPGPSTITVAMACSAPVLAVPWGPSATLAGGVIQEPPSRICTLAVVVPPGTPKSGKSALMPEEATTRKLGTPMRASNVEPAPDITNELVAPARLPRKVKHSESAWGLSSWRRMSSFWVATRSAATRCATSSGACSTSSPAHECARRPTTASAVSTAATCAGLGPVCSGWDSRISTSGCVPWAYGPI